MTKGDGATPSPPRFPAARVGEGTAPPAGKRVPFGWPTFAVPAPGGASVVLRWTTPEAVETDDPARLRVTVALDVRENKRVEAHTATSGERLGAFDIRFASVCQPYEITVAPEKARAAAREGVRLQMTEGESPLWLFDGDSTSGGAPPEFAPHWLGRVARGGEQRWAQFEARLCSPASLQAFGWIEGCVMDGLWQRAQRPGGEAAKAALAAHVRRFVTPDGDLNYEGPGSTPLRNAVYGMEGLLPFALIARVEPKNPVLKLAEREMLSRRDGAGAVSDGGNMTTEGAYIAGYPLAVLARLWDRDDLARLALAQLRARRDRNVVGGKIWQAASADGKTRLPNWARGVAWYLLGFARVLDVLEPGDDAADLYAEFKRAALWTLPFQRPDGLWGNFLDDARSVTDTSGSAGIGAALALGARRGWLPETAREAARRTASGLEAHLTPDGFLGGMAQFNKGGEALQRSDYRVIAPMAMGLAAQLRAELRSR